MNAKTKKTIIIVGASTLIGFLGDIIMYSLATSKGQKFKVTIPKGRALAQVIVVGFVTGVIVDYAVNIIIESQKSNAEKSLDKLAKEDLKRIESGDLKETIANEIIWT